MNVSKKIFYIILFYLAFLPAAEALETAAKNEKYVSEGGFFKCELPAGWKKGDYMGQPAAEKKVYSVDVYGPANKDGVNTLISVAYYAPGNTLFKSMSRFIRLNSRAIAGLETEGEEYSAVSGTVVAGLKAKKFERKKMEFLPPDQAGRRKIPVAQKFIVAPARTAGFYVLKYYAPSDIAEQNLKAFENLVSSFQPVK